MTQYNKNKRIMGMIIGMIIGIGVGLALGNIALGAGIGVTYGIVFSKVLSGEELVKDKKTRRRVSWGLLSTSILGCLAFGYIIGDLVLGLTAGIGFSFVIGLKWEKLYDERMSHLFSKASRNAFVVINAGLSLVLMFSQMETPLINIPLGTALTYVIYLSWAVFLISWFYHSNKGE